jgi:hypothetical protein
LKVPALAPRVSTSRILLSSSYKLLSLSTVEKFFNLKPLCANSLSGYLSLRSKALLSISTGIVSIVEFLLIESSTRSVVSLEVNLNGAGSSFIWFDVRKDGRSREFLVRVDNGEPIS